MDYVDRRPRDQISRMSLDQRVAPDAFARVMYAFVDAIDLESFNLVHSNDNVASRTR